MSTLNRNWTWFPVAKEYRQLKINLNYHQMPLFKMWKKKSEWVSYQSKTYVRNNSSYNEPGKHTGMYTQVISVGFYPVRNTSSICAHRRWKTWIWMWVWYWSNVFGMKTSATSSDQIFRACIDACLLYKTIELHIMLYSLKHHCV